MSPSSDDRVIPLPVDLDGRVAADELTDEVMELLDGASTQTRFAVATMLAACRVPGVTGTLVISVDADRGALEATFSSP